MNTSGFVGTFVGSVILLSGLLWFLKKFMPNGTLTDKISELIKLLSYDNVVEVDELSLRTYGAWMKTLDLPNFDDCHFYVIKMPISKLPSNFSAQREKFGDVAYAFVVTDAKITKVIASQVTLAVKFDSKFEQITTQEVTEIKL